MLTIVENLFLLSVDDVKGTTIASEDPMFYGLAGALLAELALRGRLSIQDRKIVVADQTPTGDELLDETLAQIASTKKPRKPSHWVEEIASRKLLKQVGKRLVDANILRMEEKRYLWVVPYQAYTQKDASAKYWIKERLRSIVLAGGVAEPQDVALLSLLKACSLLELVFTRDERKVARFKANELAAGEVFGAAVAEVLAGINAAMIAAVTVASNVS